MHLLRLLTVIGFFIFCSVTVINSAEPIEKEPQVLNESFKILYKKELVKLIYSEDSNSFNIYNNTGTLLAENVPPTVEEIESILSFKL